MIGPLPEDELQRRLAQLPRSSPPPAVWESIVADLDRPASPARDWRVTAHPWAAAAMVLVAVGLGLFAGFYRAFVPPAEWAVMTLASESGAPAGGGSLAPGAWLETGQRSRVELTVGRIGRVAVEPASRLRLLRSRWNDHRLDLARGEITAVISAPPRLFFVQTPAGVVTDLGCAYTLSVDSAGVSRLRVTVGWVELGRRPHRVVVPAGMAADAAPGQPPGVPYTDDLPEPARRALDRLAQGTGTRGDLDTLLDGLHSASAPVTLRRLEAVTLWHLLPRVVPELREPLVQAVDQRVPIPDGVTRAAVLALEPGALERWRRELNPMWAESADTWIGAAARWVWVALLGE